MAVLLPFIPHPGTNTKVTPDHTTPTDGLEQGEIDRALGFLANAESIRKEVAPTPTPPPSPTPEATPTPEESEPSEEIEAAGEIVPQGEVKPQEETEPPTEIEPSEENTITFTSLLSDGQILEGAWITHFDCDFEGHCGSRTASGTYLTEGGPFAACDTDYWPFGTKMTIVGDPYGYVWTCADVGTAIVGPAHWDVWFYYRANGEAYLNQIGGDTQTVKILPP